MPGVLYLGPSFVKRLLGNEEITRFASIGRRSLYTMPDEHLVGALGLNVTWLLALVASALARSLGGAVTAQVTNLATVVALLALGTIPRHVAVTSAGVAGLSWTTTTTTEAATETSLLATVSATGTAAISTSLGAVTSDVSDLGALVALLGSTATGREATATTSSALNGRVGAITGDVTWLTALVACLVLRTLWAFTAHVSFTTTVIALSRASGWAIASLVRSIATVVATAGLSTTTV